MKNRRRRSGSCLRSAASTSGPDPNDRTVAEVMNPTSCCHPGKGRKKISPTTKASAIEIRGTPR